MRYLSIIILSIFLFVSCTSNEREVTYKVEGTAEKARVTFTTGENEDAFSKEVVALPWEHTVNMPVGSEVAINAQNMGSAGTVETVIEIEGEQVQRHESSRPYGMALTNTSVPE